MIAMIFAAGLGTRLKPFTLSYPKALVEVGGKPMLQRVIERLRDEGGVRSMVVNMHHFAPQIADFISKNKSFGIDIRLSDESDMLLDTGGGIVAAAKMLREIGQYNEPIIVHNADILSDFSIADMLAYHTSGHVDATLLVKQRDTSRYLLFDNDMVMKGWTNISTSQVRPATLSTQGLDRYAFGGVHILSTKAVDALCRYNGTRVGDTNAEGVHKFSIIDFYIDTCSENRYLGYAPDTQYMWHDIGKPESLEAARKMFS